ncbi:MAG: pyridoxamine 5'-phosphate oxidase family protein [Actinomycetota bacterium]
MSIPVDLTALTDAIDSQAAFAYLFTVSDDSTPHLIAVTPRLTHDTLDCAVGRTSLHNASARSRISLVWPPLEPGGYSLIVDGDATTGDGTVALRPTRAVLHRPAPGGGNDCAPITPE